MMWLLYKVCVWVLWLTTTGCRCQTSPVSRPLLFTLVSASWMKRMMTYCLRMEAMMMMDMERSIISVVPRVITYCPRLYSSCVAQLICPVCKHGSIRFYSRWLRRCIWPVPHPAPSQHHYQVPSSSHPEGAAPCLQSRTYHKRHPVFYGAGPGPERSQWVSQQCNDHASFHASPDTLTIVCI